MEVTWAKMNMARSHGRLRRGRCLMGRLFHGHWKTMTFVPALGHDAITPPLVIDVSMNGATIRAHVEHVLAPTLEPGDIVILDNLGNHRGAKVRRLIEACGAELRFLPLHSPDLDPIELAFAKLKSPLRSAGVRTVEQLWQRIGRLIDQFTPDECSSYLKHVGYAYN